MKELTNEELKDINGGTLSATFLNAIIRGAELMLELGRAVGTAIRKRYSKYFC